MTYVKALSFADELVEKIKAGKGEEGILGLGSKGLIEKPLKIDRPDLETTNITFYNEYSALRELEERINKASSQEEMPEMTGPSTVGEVAVTRPKTRASSGVEPVPGNLNDLSAAREALAAVESRGSGDYAAIGPVVNKGQYKGQRAYGRYQVMEGNIGPWTKEVFGKAYTTEEFMADPKIQDAVVEHQLKKSYNRYGNFDDAASVWFSGQPVSKAGNRSDGFTTVPDYVKKFRGFFYNYKVKE
jgi:hypothetical protein